MLRDGNRFEPQSINPIMLDSASKRLSMRFTEVVSDAEDVDKVMVRVHRDNSAPLYWIGIQGDNNGEPDGTWLDRGTLDPAGAAPNWAGAEGLRITLTKGNVYHVVVEYQGVGDIGPDNFASFFTLDYRVKFYPMQSQDGFIDTALAVGVDEGSGWDMEPKMCPVWMHYRTGSDRTRGQAVHAIHEYLLWSNLNVAQRYKVRAGRPNLAHSRLRTYARYKSDKPEEDLFFDIYRSDVVTGEPYGPVLASGVAFPARELQEYYTWWDVNLVHPTFPNEPSIENEPEIVIVYRTDTFEALPWYLLINEGDSKAAFAGMDAEGLSFGGRDSRVLHKSAGRPWIHREDWDLVFGVESAYDKTAGAAQ